MKKKRTIRIYKPQPYQLAVHNGLELHWENGIHCVKAIRQCGKSLMLQNIAIKASLSHGAQTSIYISPTFKQCKEMFKSIKRACKGTGLIAQANASTYEITFCNDSQIVFLSAEQGDNIRGYTVTRWGVLMLDEAAYIKDDVFYAATPFVNANNAPIVMVSTPRFRDGFFYNFFVDGYQDKPGIYSYDFTQYPTPFLTKERLEMLRSKMPLNLFRADYLGEWMEATSTLFGNFARILSNQYRQGTVHKAAIDWGVGKDAKSEDSDYTVLSVMNEHKEQVKLCRWNDTEPMELIRSIVKVLRDYNVESVTIETNSIGGVYLGLLRTEVNDQGLNCSIIEFVTTNDSKREIIEGLIVGVQNQDLQLLDDPQLKVQFAAYQMEKTKSGKGITYNATSGYHDDIVIASALNYHAFKQAQYAFYFV